MKLIELFEGDVIPITRAADRDETAEQDRHNRLAQNTLADIRQTQRRNNIKPVPKKVVDMKQVSPQIINSIEQEVAKQIQTPVVRIPPDAELAKFDDFKGVQFSAYQSEQHIFFELTSNKNIKFHFDVEPVISNISKILDDKLVPDKHRKFTWIFKNSNIELSTTNRGDTNETWYDLTLTFPF